MRVVYRIDADSNLNYVLALVHEIRAEMGLVPEQIQTNDGRSITFDLQDWKRLNRGDITEDEYITRHVVTQ
ncbi:hypothetical protein [Phocaeicola plebeius]|jgi:hypothetical protein|uniref:hypothetical protein n=1 Tax=Phocaeicola plebeius TaxID=310297 RepID=UPI002013A187|nr:hypothetical protein [Phocaeicola plebeius]MCL1613133.1 hypothetical protein [Phocaeicola plebeius]